MDVVALLTLGTSVEAEAAVLAPDLGITVYETALLLRVASPIPLLRTDDRARALDLVAKLRARGHDAIACDGATVAASGSMTRVRSFRLEAGALVNADAEGKTSRLPWDEIMALVRAVHRTRSERIEKSVQTKVSFGRAALSGGLGAIKTTTKETKHTTDDRENVLYVFRRFGAPWLIEQSSARYEGLGSDLRPSQTENFTTLVRRLRESAPHAPFDERLMIPRGSSETMRASATGHQQSTAGAVDLLAHLVAMAITRSLSPFR
ncbi:MAG: hypothetical protein KF819_36650 [Labilithrix sp.]|nr:hypothetical protein [Labilithrix sp.]